METWKLIREHCDYSISDFGRVKSNKKNLLMRLTLNNGYYAISFHLGNHKYKTYRIHRLVASYFIPNPNNLPQVNHIDGNRLNNNVSNLEWCDASHNLKHANRIGLHNPKRGSSNGKSKLDENSVLIIKERLSRGERYNHIAKDFSVSPTTIYSIWKKKSWTWLD